MLVFRWVKCRGLGWRFNAVTWELCLRLEGNVDQKLARAKWLHWQIWCCVRRRRGRYVDRSFGRGGPRLARGVGKGGSGDRPYGGSGVCLGLVTEAWRIC